MSREKKVAETFTNKKNLTSTVLAREEICKITFSRTSIPRLAILK
jgi:hypothetical protein